MTPKEKSNLEVAFVLMRQLLGYISTCKERNYKMEPKTLKMYRTRIKERLCADEEKDDA